MKTHIIHPGTWLNMVGVEHPNNPGKLWEGVFRKGTGQVVGAVVENISRNTFVLVEQFRPLVDARVIELVAGLVNPGMNPDDAILKEIREETGYIGEKAHFLLTGPKSAGITNETTLDYYVSVTGNPGLQELESSEVGLIVHECQNSLSELKRFLASEEKSGKLISPGIWAGFGKAIADGVLSYQDLSYPNKGYTFKKGERVTIKVGGVEYLRFGKNNSGKGYRVIGGNGSYCYVHLGRGYGVREFLENEIEKIR